MPDKMISHMAKELLMEQILTDGFKIFEDMGLEFNDEQIELLKEYLDALLENNIVELERDYDVLIEGEEVHNYVSRLIELVLSLTFFCFTNWGIALFYKNGYPNNNSDE